MWKTALTKRQNCNWSLALSLWALFPNSNIKKATFSQDGWSNCRILTCNIFSFHLFGFPARSSFSVCLYRFNRFKSRCKNFTLKSLKHFHVVDHISRSRSFTLWGEEVTKWNEDKGGGGKYDGLERGMKRTEMWESEEKKRWGQTKEQ